MRRLLFRISTKPYTRKESMLVAVEIDDVVGVRQTEIRVAETLVFEPLRLRLAHCSNCGRADPMR